MKVENGVELTPSALSHTVIHGTLSMHRAIQILAVCRAGEIEIKSDK
jgi:hypothetical protein